MTYSYKTLLFISTSAISSTLYSHILFPSFVSDSYNLGLATLLVAIATAKNQNQSKNDLCVTPNTEFTGGTGHKVYAYKNHVLGPCDKAPGGALLSSTTPWGNHSNQELPLVKRYTLPSEPTQPIPQIALRWSEPLNYTSYNRLQLEFNGLSQQSVSLWLPGLELFFQLMGFLVTFFFIDLALRVFSSSLKSFFWFKPYNFLKTNFFMSYTYLTSVDAIVSFSYFFLSLYFLELHFFFVYSLNLSSDSTIYQFNFLLSSFFFIFLIKTLRGLTEKGFLFSTNFHFNEFMSFNSAKLSTVATAGPNPVVNRISEDDYVSSARFALRIGFFVFFFFSTFFVWLLRFIIQFVRLLVLFMIHTIFELVIVSSDTVLSGYLLNHLFFLKYLFFVFFFFGAFLYLIIYLNLMFTLQVFIFYFFSEVFQSNFITDLSSFVSAKLKKI